MFIYFTGLRLHSTSYSSLSCHNRAKNIENYEFMITVVIFVPLYMAELVRLCAKKKNRKIIINNWMKKWISLFIALPKVECKVFVLEYTGQIRELRAASLSPTYASIYSCVHVSSVCQVGGTDNNNSNKSLRQYPPGADSLQAIVECLKKRPSRSCLSASMYVGNCSPSAMLHSSLSLEFVFLLPSLLMKSQRQIAITLHMSPVL